MNACEKRFTAQKCLELLHDLQLPGHAKEAKAVLLGRLQDHYEGLFPAFVASHNLHCMDKTTLPATTDTDPETTANLITAATPDPHRFPVDGKKRRCAASKGNTPKTVDQPGADDEPSGNSSASPSTRIHTLSERPSKAELFQLRDEDLRVVLHAVGLGRRNRGGKEPMVLKLLKWLKDHPGLPLPLPEGLRRSLPLLRTGHASGTQSRRPSELNHPDTFEHSKSGRSERQQNNQTSLHQTANTKHGQHPELHSPDQSTPLGSPFRRPLAAFPPPPSYAAAVDLQAALRSSITTHSLEAILERAQQVLQLVVDDHRYQSHLSSSTLPSSINPQLATQALCSVRELQATRAGLVAVLALSPHPHPASTQTVRSQLPASPPSPTRRPNRAWVHARCVVLDPPEDRFRRLPTDFTKMGATIEQALRSTLSLTSSPLVELLRRTSKGGYCVQFSPSCSTQAQALSSLTLDDGTIWRCTPLQQSSSIFTSGDKNLRRATIRRDSFIVAGVPESIDDSKLLTTFAASNAERLQLSPAMLAARLKSAERLQRRLSRGPDAGKWVPSHSVRFSGDTSLVNAILATGHAILDFRALEVRHYSFPSRTCFHCGLSGHVAKHCRSRCHRCTSRHPTQPCPLGKHAPPSAAQFPPNPTGFPPADVTGFRPTGRPN